MLEDQRSQRVTEVLASRRWTLDIAEAIMRDWHASGLSLRAFGLQRGIGYQRLRSWRKKLECRDTGRFIRIDVNQCRDPDIEVCLVNGRIIRCRGLVDPNYLKTVVDILER